jgi:hypothetical protein
LSASISSGGRFNKSTTKLTVTIKEVP